MQLSLIYGDDGFFRFVVRVRGPLCGRLILNLISRRLSHVDFFKTVTKYIVLSTLRSLHKRINCEKTIGDLYYSQ